MKEGRNSRLVFLVARLGLAMLLLLMLGLTACGDTATNATQSSFSTTTTQANSSTMEAATQASSNVSGQMAGKLKVLATTTQLGDFARNIGGERVDVTQILKAGDDPHDYEPTAADSKNAAAAQIIFKNGVGLDDWLDKVIANSGTKAITIDTSKNVKIAKNDNPDEAAGDPHIWQSTENAKVMVANIADGLSQIDPAGKTYYQSQLQSYQAQLDKVAQQINQVFAPTPAAQRKLVTNHDAFGYFAAEFNVDIVGSIIPSFSDAAQPTPAEINDLIKNIKTNNVKVIFTETSINPKVAQQIAKTAGVKIYSNLYGDSLGNPGSDGATYLAMMLSNAKNMEAGFQQE